MAPSALLWFIGTISAHAAPITPEQLDAALDRFNEHAVWALPEVDAEGLAQLASGEVVRWVDRPEGEDGPRRAGALYVAQAPRDQMWLACQDPHFQGDPSVFELKLRTRPPDDSDWYGLLDLPAPFDDRQWLVRSWNNHDMAKATGGQAWEHPWKAIDASLEEVKAHAAQGKIGPVTPERIDDAVLTPSNHGAYVAIALPDGRTLFGYHAVFRAGGVIPDWAVTQYAYSGLEKAMKRFEERARSVIPEHHGPDHRHIYGGDGQPVVLGP